MTRAAVVLLVALAGVQLIDIAFHLATGHVEVLRIVASAVIVVGAVVATTGVAPLAAPARWAIMGTAAAIYLLLNVVFLVDAGLVNPTSGAPRIPLFVFVAMTLATAVVLMAVRGRTAR